VLLFSNLVYTIIYTPLLFHTFLKESNHIRHKEDSHPLLETASMKYAPHSLSFGLIHRLANC